jgi:hypothetical protein
MVWITRKNKSTPLIYGLINLKRNNIMNKTALNISIEDKGKYKNIFKVKSKYYKLNNEEKEALLKELMFWTRQEINNLHPEQE